MPWLPFQAMTLRPGDAVWVALGGRWGTVLCTVRERHALGWESDPDGVDLRVEDALGRTFWVGERDLVDRHKGDELMGVQPCYAMTLRPGDTIWAVLLPGRDPVLVTVERLDIIRHTTTSEAVHASLVVRTTMGNTVTICQSDILRRAS